MVKPKKAPRAKAAPKAGSGGSARGKNLQATIKQFNAWREQFNPLVGLDMKRARTLLEAGQRGEFADLQWTYKFVEESFPTSFALIERCTSPLLEMEWTVTQTEEEALPEGCTPDQAAKQANYLRQCYERIGNLEDAIEHIAMAKFRGFAHLQLQDKDGDGEIDCFELLDQWNFVRAGLHGNWWWNPDALQTSYKSLPKGNEITDGDLTGGNGDNGGPSGTGQEPSTEKLSRKDFIIREVKRPVNPIALRAYIRWAMGKKDHAGFIEIYGIPGAVVIGPPNVSKEKETEYQSAGQSIAEGGSGYMPNGSDVKFPDGPRGVNPFKEFLRGEVEDVVLAGTGGLLTMLTESGSGTLGGSAHSETFNKIARSEAKKVSAVFQRDFDKQLLADEFPDQPVLAYFELQSMDETAAETLKFKREVWRGFMSDGTVADILANQTDLKQLTKDVELPVIEEYVDPYVPVETKAGKMITGELLRDGKNGKTGDIIGARTESGADPAVEPGAAKPTDANAFMRNRALRSARLHRNRALAGAFDELLGKAETEYDRARVESFQPLRERLAGVLALPNFEEQTAALKDLKVELPGLLLEINATTEAGTVIEQAMNKALEIGVEQGAANNQ